MSISLSSGRPGGSAAARRDAIVSARARDLAARYGAAAPLVMAVSRPPAAQRAWSRGAAGEAAVANALAAVPGLRLLHDRRRPGTTGNLDHLVVGPAGVLLVDAKNYTGPVVVIPSAGLAGPGPSLRVAGRRQDALAAVAAGQAAGLRQLVAAAGVRDVPVTGALCFTAAPVVGLSRVGGVTVCDLAGLLTLAGQSGPLGADRVAALAELLDNALPAAR